MRKKRIVTKCLLFSLLLTSILFWQITERYQAASSYDNALEFFNSTGNNSGKHIECYNGNIYFGTSAKLAHTYASGGHKYYNTLGYDVTLTGGGTSLTFSVKRGGSLKEVPGSSRVDKNGYEYLLYCISREKIEDLAKKADPVNAATVFEAAEIKVRMDAIVTVRQNGVQGSIVEDGKGGITEYEANGAIYHLKNEWELEDIKEVFPGHKFESYFDIYDTLRNFSLEVYYGANGKPALSESSSTVVTNNKYKYANVTIKDVYVPYALGDGTKLYVTTSRLLNSFYLLKPSDISMVKEGYHLDTNAEWITKDDMVVSANAIQDPKKLIPSAGLQNEKLVLYANWKPNTYYVEYYANGGTGTMSKTTATYDKEFKLTKNAFSRTGYKFIGWATSENSKTVVYTDQKTVSNLTAANEGTVKLYAVWQELVYTVTLDSTTPVNKDAQKPGTKNFFEKYNIGFYKEKDCATKISSITAPEEPGYIFMGYYSGKNGAGAQYIDESGKFLSSATSTTFISDRILYAKWKPIEYTIRYNANGGKGSMDDTLATYDKETFLRSNAFTLTGYKFTGWATSANGSVIYDDLEEILNLTMTDGKVINLYAVWEANIYIIDLNNDGADIAAGTSVYYEKYEKGNYTTEGCTQTISSITKPQKKGYIFGGYYTSREGLGDEYIDATGKILSTSTTFTSHKTLYAKWIPHEYTIKYDANGGTGTMEDTKAVYDKEVTLRTAMFTNTGKNFMGWSAEKNGNVHYSDRDTVLNLTEEDGGEIILYAVWSENIYTITLNSDGADNNGTENYYEKYDVGNYKDSGCTTEISTITKPQKNGYVFGGYYTSKGGAGVSYIDASGKITATSTTFTTNKTLYAKWTITGYTIQYDGNGGVGSMTDTEAVYNQTVSLRPNGFLNSGKSFKGWSRTRDGAVEFKDKQSVRNLNTVDGEIITLYAVWEEDLYTITLNSDGAEIQGTEKYYEKYSIGNYKDSDCIQIITTITKPVWTGRTFGGYYTGKDGTGDSYINSAGTITAENTTFTSDITLYAKWTPNRYRIKYDANGGSGTMMDTVAVYGEALPLSTCTFTFTGRTFKGWSLTADGSARYADKETVRNLTLDESITLYAVWEEDVYTITLNNDGGETKGTECYYEKYSIGNYSDRSCKQEISSITKPTRTGRTFGGYYTGRDGTGEQYISSSGSITATNTTFTSDTTLYAYWLTNAYTIKYDANGGTGSMADTTVFYGETVSLSPCTFTNTGKMFKGWSLTADGSAQYADKDSVKNLTLGTSITLYAVWQEDVYTIILNNEGAETAGSENYYEKYSIGNYKDSSCTQIISSITKPAWTGKTFGGYYTGRDGTGDQYVAADGTIMSTSTTFTSDTTLYAYWMTNTYTIRYNANVGTASMADTTVSYGETVSLRPCTFTFTGRTFIGWSTTANDAVQYKDKESVKDLAYSGTVILYAVWQEDVYTIILNNEGAERAGSENYYEKYSIGNYKDSACTQKISSITKPAWTGKTFGGYYTGRDGTGEQYISSSGSITATNTTFTSDTTLYAYWLTNAYTIKYNANGGTGSMADTTVSYGETVSLSPCTFTNTGKTFKGWSLTADGSAQYADKDSVKNLTLGISITLYAVWEEDVYTITLNNDGGETKGTENYYEKYSIGNYKDSSCTQIISSITKPAWTGKTFGGYYTGRDGTGDQYVAADGTIMSTSTTFTSDTTLYAYWMTNTYTIRYNANGGSGTMADTSVTYGETVSLRPCTFTNTGRTFKGWSRTTDGSVQYPDKESITNLAASGTVILYAVWEENVYTVTLNSEGAENTGTGFYYEKYSIGNFSDSSCSQSISSITKPSWAGKTFGGYYTGRNGTGTQYISASGSITASDTTFTSDTILYACWTTNTYTIRYNANGGSGTMADTSVAYGETVSLRTCTFTNTGHTFKGWSTAADGSVWYVDRDSVKDLAYSGTVVLYAVWEPYSVQISLDHQGGTGDRNAFYEKYGTAFYSDSLFSSIITQITKPVMPGFTFKGYFENSMGSGNPVVNESGTIAVGNTAFLKDILVFAKWVPKMYMVTLDQQGGTEGSTSVTATYGQLLPSADAPQRPGYIFKGYYTEKGGNGTKFYDGFMNTDIVYMEENDRTLYAYWMDESAPEVVLTASPEKWTNQKVTLTAHASDNGSGLASVIIYEIASDDSLIPVASADGLNGAKTKEISFENTKEGVVRYKAVAEDAAGNTAESYSTAYYDITAPEAELTFNIDETVISIELDITDINTGD